MAGYSIGYSLINYTSEHWTLHAQCSPVFILSPAKLYKTINNEEVPLLKLIFGSLEWMMNENTDFPSGELCAVWMVARFVPIGIVFHFEVWFIAVRWVLAVGRLVMWKFADNFNILLTKAGQALRIELIISVSINYKLNSHIVWPLSALYAVNQCQSPLHLSRKMLNVHRYHVACVFNSKSQNEIRIHKKWYRLETWPDTAIRCYFVRYSR